MSKNKIILINCPPWGVVMPPLGVAYLATYLKNHNIEVEVLDLNLQLYKKSAEKEKKLWDLDTINKVKPEDIAQELYNSFFREINDFILYIESFEIIGFSANNLISTTFAGILSACIKECYKDKTIILGGPGCYHSWDRKYVPLNAVDFFVIGEGEKPLLNLIENINNGLDYSEISGDIPGVLSCQKNKKRKFIPASGIESLDDIPFPTFEEFDLSQYNYAKDYRPLPILTSRGCINHCSYCIDWYMCAKFRIRSPEHILDEIKQHINCYGITHVEFNDLLCNGNITQLEKLCDLIIESNIDIRWISYAAIRKNMSDKLLKKMEKAGCNSLCYGVESGSNKVLKRMNKYYTKEDAVKLLKITHQAGITTSINIIVGFPSETADDFEETLNFIRENKVSIDQVTNVSAFVLMPGADLAIYPHKFGIKFLDPDDPAKWTDENGLTQLARNNRVQIVRKLLDELKIKSLIINYQQDIPQAQNNLIEKEKDKIALTLDAKSDKKEDTPRRTIRRSKRPVLLMILFIFSIMAELYLKAIKKIRGSVIFPGN